MQFSIFTIKPFYTYLGQEMLSYAKLNFITGNVRRLKFKQSLFEQGFWQIPVGLTIESYRY